MKIYDFQSEEKDMDWLATNYGDVQVLVSTDDEFEVVEIHERVNTAAILACTVLDEHGEPIPGFEMAFYWPNAPETPGCGGYGRAVRATTKDEGEASVPIGPGAY